MGLVHGHAEHHRLGVRRVAQLRGRNGIGAQERSAGQELQARESTHDLAGVGVDRLRHSPARQVGDLDHAIRDGCVGRDRRPRHHHRRGVGQGVQPSQGGARYPQRQQKRQQAGGAPVQVASRHASSGDLDLAAARASRLAGQR